MAPRRAPAASGLRAGRGGAKSWETIRTFYLPPAHLSSPFASLFTPSLPTMSLPSLLFVRPPVPVPVPKDGPTRGFPQLRCHLPEKMLVEGRAVALVRRRGGEPEPATSPRPVRHVLQPHRPSRIPLEDGNGQVGAPRPGSGGPNGRPRRSWEIGNGWPVWRCTRCTATPPHLHTLPATDGGRGVEAHLLTCRHSPTQDEICMTRSVLGPNALPPQPHPIPPSTPRYPRGGAPSPRAGTSNPTPARPPHPSRVGWSCP